MNLLTKLEQSARGSFKSFVHKRYIKETESLRKLLEEFVQKKPKYEEVIDADFVRWADKAVVQKIKKQL